MSWAFSSPGCKDLLLLSFFFQSFIIVTLLWTLSLSASFLHCGYQTDKWWGEGNDHVSISPLWSNAGHYSLHPQGVMHLWMQPRVWFSFVAAVLHHSLMFSLLFSTRTPRPLPARLFPSHTGLNLYWAFWLLHPRCRTWCFVKLHAGFACPSFQPVQVYLYEGSALWYVQLLN